MQMTKHFRLLFAASSLLWLSACSQSPLEEEPPLRPLAERLAQLGYQQAEAIDAIQRYDIERWHYLDPQHIWVDSGPQRAFLIRFVRPCRNLRFDNAMGYTDTLGRLTRHDKVLSAGTSGVPESCLIDELFRLKRLESSKP